MSNTNPFVAKNGLQISNSTSVTGISTATIVENDNILSTTGAIYRALSAVTNSYNFVYRTGDTMTGPLVVNSTLNVTGLTTLATINSNSITPNINNTSSLGSSSKWWGNTYTRELRLMDAANGENISIQAAQVLIPSGSTSPLWTWILPGFSAASGTILGTFNGNAGSAQTTWYDFVAGNNISITNSGNTSGGSFTFSVTGLPTSDTYTTAFTYNNSNVLTLTNNTGGTLNATVSAVSALTVNQYVDFYTGNTPSYTTAGRLFYDAGSNSLSYKPYTVSGDVTLNIGQESLIYVLNNTGVQINNGQACHISGATSGVPTVTLAIANDTSDKALVSGVATHNIPNNTYGFITNFGLVHDVVVTGAGVTTDSIVYLSDTVAGGFIYSLTGLSITSRVSKIGRVTATGASGAILVNIQNEDISLQISSQLQNIFIGDTISTGVYQYSGATILSSTGGTVNVGLAKGWIVDNTTNPLSPTIISVNYSGQTGVVITNMATADATYLLINSGSTLYQQITFPTPQQRRQNIYLGKVVHPARTSLLNVNNQPDFVVSPLSQLRDMFAPIRLINDGIICSPYTGLTIQRTNGTLYGLGINFIANQLSPDNVAISAQVPASYYYRTMTGGTTPLVNTIDVTNYDVGGVVTPIGANNYTTQRIYQYPTGVMNIQYGQVKYPTQAKALAGLMTEPFTANSNTSTTGILVGLLTIKAGTSDITNTSDALFTTVSKFGELMGGTAGVSTTSLQQAYDNSIAPEITINPTLDGLTIKNYAGGLDTNHLLEGANQAGTVTSFIDAGGGISATSVSSTTISATTYLNLPTDKDTRVTGYTYSPTTNTFTISDSTGGTFTALFNTVTGLTVNGEIIISSHTHANAELYVGANAYFSGKTYMYDTLTGVSADFATLSSGGTNLLSIFSTHDYYTTSGSYSNGTLTLDDNSGNTITITGFTTGNTDTYTTGGTYTKSTGQLVLNNNTGGTVTVTGITDTYTTGGTFVSNILTLTNNTGGTVNTLLNNFSGLTVNGNIVATGTTSSANLSATSTVFATLVSSSIGAISTLGANSISTSTLTATGSTKLAQTTATTISSTTIVANSISGATISGNGESIVIGSGNTTIRGIINVTDDWGGFTNNEAIICNYVASARTITLTAGAGGFQMYYRGNLILDYASGQTWTSSAHPASPTLSQYLYYNDSGFQWASSIWNFNDVQIAFVAVDAQFRILYGVREMHGLMDWETHQELHQTIGTYRTSGGTLSGYTIASTVAANRRPTVSACRIKDEDIATNLSALASGSYTQMYLTGTTADSEFFLAQADIVPNNGTTPFYNQFTGGAWVQTLMPNNTYSAIFLVALPITSDSGSTAYRFIWMQPQSNSATLATIQALTPANLNLGNLPTISNEYVFLTRIIILRAGGGAPVWSITQVDDLTGNKWNQTSTPAGNYLSTVSVDGLTIIGDGTNANPLYVSPNLSLSGSVVFSAFTATTISATTTKSSTISATSITSSTISATTYQNLPIDSRVTGGTFTNNNLVLTNNTGGTVTTLINNFSGITVNGNLTVTGTSVLNTLTATTISADTFYSRNLAASAATNSGIVYVSTDGRMQVDTNDLVWDDTNKRLGINQQGITPTYTIDAHAAVNTNNVLGGQGNVNSWTQLNITNISSGFSASTDVCCTSNNGDDTVYYIDMGINSSTYTGNSVDNSGPNDAYMYSTGNHLWVGNSTPGKNLYLQTDGGLSGNVRVTISSATTKVNNVLNLLNAPTVNNANTQILARNSSTGNIEYKDVSTFASGTFSGGTIAGASVFTAGLTANTISATTYLNLPNAGANSRTTGTTTTTGTTLTTAATISTLVSGSNIVEVFVKATGSANITFGHFRRTLAVIYSGGSLTIPLVNSDMDYQTSLLNPNSVSFNSIGTNLYIAVSGSAANTITWTTAYEKII